MKEQGEKRDPQRAMSAYELLKAEIERRRARLRELEERRNADGKDGNR